MLTFYYSLAPNPMKVALFLEEAGLEYEAIPVDTRKGEQLKPEFTKLNPNNKVPVIVDDGTTVFDSNAILIYLAEKTGKFLPSDRAGLLEWMMFVASGVGPYSGQCVHFRHFAPEPKEYAVKRYLFEAKRHFGILNDHLAGKEWMVGDSYSIVDMAVWGWARMVPFVIGSSATDMSVWETYPNVKKLLDAVSARPAAARAIAIKDKYTFKTEMDDAARAVMFRHTVAA
jgi:GST-like protein